MARKQRYKISQVIEALEKSHGLVYIAAKALGCAPTTVYEYAKKHPDVQEAIDKNRGFFIDIAENQLMVAVNNGEKWAVEFTLKYLGRDRGYSEKFINDVSITDKTQELIKAIREADGVE